MKTKLLMSVLSAALCALPFGAHALDTSYTTADGIYTLTPVTSVSDITDSDANTHYLIRTYSTNWSSQFVFTHSDTQAIYNTAESDITADNLGDALWSVETGVTVGCSNFTSSSENHSETLNVAFKADGGYLRWNCTASTCVTTEDLLSAASSNDACAELVKSTYATDEQAVFYVHYGTNGYSYLLNYTSGIGTYSSTTFMTQYYNTTYSGYIVIYKVTLTPWTIDGEEYRITSVDDPTEIQPGYKFLIKTWNGTSGWAGDYYATHDSSNTNLVWKSESSMTTADLSSAAWDGAEGNTEANVCTADDSATYTASDGTETHASRQVCTFKSGDKYLPWGNFTTLGLTQTLGTAIDDQTNAEVVKSSLRSTTDQSVFYIHHGGSATNASSVTRNSTAFLFCNGFTSSGDGVGTFGSEANMTSYYSSTLSGYVRIFKAESLVAIKLREEKAAAVARIPEESVATVYGVTISGYDRQSYVDQINALTATTKTELATAEAEIEKIVAAAYTELSAPVIEKYSGKLYTIKNAGNSRYLGGTYTTDATYNAVLSNCDATLDHNAIWKITLTGSLENGLQAALYNPFNGKYLATAVANSNARISMADADPEMYAMVRNTISGTDYFIFRADDGYVHNNNLSPAQLYADPNWSTNVLTNWTIEEMTADDQATVYAAAKSAAAALADGRTIGSGLSEYSGSFAAKITEFGQLTDGSEFDTVAAAYRDLIATPAADRTFTLNMPEANSYFRIKSTSGDYLTAAGIFSMESSLTNNSIMWYGDGQMADYVNGYAFIGANGFATASTIDSNTPVAMAIAADQTIGYGKYAINYGESNTAYLSSVALEKVTSLPVTINGGVGTICVPVALTIPEGPDCYVGSLNGTNLTIHKAEAGDTYPAGTPIMVATDAETVSFEIADDATTASTFTTSADFAGETLARKLTDTDNYVYAPSAATTAAQAPAIRRVSDAEGADDASSKIAFGKISEGTLLAPNVPILSVSKQTVDAASTTSVDSFAIDLSDADTEDQTFSVVSVVTSLSELNADATAADAVYFDLQGRRIGSPSAHGIYIQRGIKIRK
jgi:hypothetical protein